MTWIGRSTSLPVDGIIMVTCGGIDSTRPAQELPLYAGDEYSRHHEEEFRQFVLLASGNNY
jgi:hypothetical protein